jgi:hypothetical protein
MRVISSLLSATLLFGVLLTRQWLRRREPVAAVDAVPPTLSHQLPTETEASVVPQASATPEVAAVRFAARREPGETTIVLAPHPARAEEPAENSSHHA